jgi:transposase
MDLHRRRSVLVRMTGDGRKLETVRIENSPAALRAVLAWAGKNPRVVLEATYGWYWAVDVLEAAGAEVHLAHPLGVRAFSAVDLILWQAGNLDAGPFGSRRVG